MWNRQSRVLSICHQRIQDIKIFFVARCKIIAQISCLKCRYKEIRQKIGYLRVETKSRSVGIVIKKWSFKQENEIRLCIA